MNWGGPGVLKVSGKPGPPRGWRAALWADVRTALPEHLNTVTAASWAEILPYTRDPAQRMPLHVGLFVVLALAFGIARRQIEQWRAVGTALSSALMVFTHPYAAALLVTLLQTERAGVEALPRKLVAWGTLRASSVRTGSQPWLPDSPCRAPHSPCEGRAARQGRHPDTAWCPGASAEAWLQKKRAATRWA